MREEEEEAAAAESKWQVKILFTLPHPFNLNAKEPAPSMRDRGQRSKSNRTRGSHGGQPSPATPPTTHGNLGTTIMAPAKSCLNGQIQSKRPHNGPTRRVTFHLSQHSARHRVSGGAVAIKRHP